MALCLHWSNSAPPFAIPDRTRAGVGAEGYSPRTIPFMNPSFSITDADRMKG